MWIYLLNFFLILFLAGSANTSKSQQQYFGFSMCFLALFVGLADMLGGYDRYIYCALFDEIADCSNSNLLNMRIFAQYSKELGYCIWNVLIAQFTSNRYIYVLLTTLFMYLMFYRAIKQNVENPMVALVLFMPLIFFFSFTYLRQMLAVAFAWQAFQYIEKRDLKMFVFWLLIAFSFHNSAIIFFPMYFLPTKKMSLNVVNSILIVSFFLGVSGLASKLFELYSSYDIERVAHAGYNVDMGFRWAYLAESLFFYYFINKDYKYLGNDKKTAVGLNSAIIFCSILLIFIRSENGGRLGWFYIIGLFSIFSSIYSIKTKSSNLRLVYLVCFCLYFRIIVSWGVLLSPYKTFLTPGVREGDFIREKYEYDYRYDNNKFYR